MLRRPSSAVVVAILSVVFLTASSHRASATSLTFVGVNLGCVPNGGTDPNACPNHDGDKDASFYVDGQGGFLEVTDENDGVADTHFDYSGKADAQYGILHAGAEGTFSGLTPNDPTSIRTVFAVAGVSDLLTISAPGMTGTGTLDVSLLLDGLIQNINGGAFAFVGVSAGQNPGVFDNPGAVMDGILVVPSQPITLTVPFTWNTPFYLGLVMGVGAGTPVSCALCVSHGDANPTPATTASGSGTADLFNTLTLIGLVPTDDDNPTVPVLNAQFSSGSGAVYSTAGIEAQPVPEPASLLLLGSGLAWTLRRRSRR